MSEKDFWEGYVPEPVKPSQQEPEHIVHSNRRYSPLLTRMASSARRIEELEAMLERQTARIVDLQTHIVDLQTHIENFDGEE